MHEGEPQVIVRRDIRLPAKHSGKRSRQIDVLLDGRFAGYSTMLAIECKNYSRPGDIGQFRDLLEDVGFYANQGVLVSASGFRSGALSRARELGIKVYELTGLTPDRLSAAVQEAAQLMILMVPGYSGLTLRNDVERAGPDELMTLFDTDGNVVAYLPDLIWFNWLAGKPPSILGEYELDLDVPKGGHTRVSNRRVPIVSASAKVKVEAAVVALPGTGSNFAMIDPEDQSLQRSHSMMKFENAPGEYPVLTFSAESELERFIRSRTGPMRITVGRIRVPRFRVNYIYWPPSKRVLSRMFHLQRFYEAGRIRKPRP